MLGAWASSMQVVSPSHNWMRTCLTYCWVRVEPPPLIEPLPALPMAARMMDCRSMAPCSKKRWSSIATWAICISGEILSSGTYSRFSSKKVASTEPSAISMVDASY